MRRLLPALLLLLAAQLRADDISAAVSTGDAAAAGAVVMERLYAAFPEGPLELAGELRSTRRDGGLLAEYGVLLRYQREGGVFDIELELSDAFGRALERIELKGVGGGAVNIAYWREGSDQALAPPDLSAPVAATDFTWSDLTLAFLWWERPEIVGVDSVKGRECYQVRMQPPQKSESAAAGVELSIDTEMYALLRARFFGPDDDTLRRFDVKSFAKTGELWMVKDIDMRSYPARSRTALRIRSVSGAGVGEE
jgi:hypothetical protein